MSRKRGPHTTILSSSMLALISTSASGSVSGPRPEPPVQAEGAQAEPSSRRVAPPLPMDVERIEAPSTAAARPAPLPALRLLAAPSRVSLAEGALFAALLSGCAVMGADLLLRVI